MDAPQRQPEHKPVLVEEILRLQDPQPGQTFLDGTVGLGGHGRALIPRLAPAGRYIGLDVDEAMVAAARTRLSESESVDVDIRVANYADIAAVLAEMGLAGVDHVLIDLGVNSAQLDDPQRGFSFEQEGPLDMRFDRRLDESAADLINGLSESELADLFYFNAQEGQSRKIARQICQARRDQRITTTRALASAVELAMVSEGGRPSKHHPATRVFQALRIAVNDELGNLDRFLGCVTDHVRPGGTVGVISFHSLEDKRVKRFVRDGKAAKRLIDLTPRPVTATGAERGVNPRSRSAKLRVARIAGEPG